MSAHLRAVPVEARAIEIEIGVEMPSRPRGNGTKYPWRTMRVGDSFFVPGRTAQKFGSHLHAAKIATGFKFASRTMDGGVRVWRVA